MYPIILCQIILLLLLAVPVSAGDWRVIPIRVDLGEGVRSGSVRLINSHTGDLRLQVSASSWTQDASGEDIYTPTDDLIFFPKLLKIPPGEERLLRVGINWSPGTSEKAYRLFVEEIPPPRTEGHSQVAVAVRFGLPVFVDPQQPRLEVEGEGLNLGPEGVSVRVVNRGNQSVKFQSVRFSALSKEGGEIAGAEGRGWYVLPGNERTFSAEFDRPVCDALDRLKVTLVGDRKSFELERAKGEICP